MLDGLQCAMGAVGKAKMFGINGLGTVCYQSCEIICRLYELRFLVSFHRPQIEIWFFAKIK
jgi:hypothetical protein